MRDFRIDVEIHAPPDRVWGIMRDIERWPEWTPTVTSIRRLDPGPLTVGSRAVIRQPKLPPAKWRVTEADEAGHSFTWVSGGPGVRVTARHWIEPRGPDCQVTLSLHFSGLFGSLMGSLTRGLNESYLAIEAEGLKRRSEAP